MHTPFAKKALTFISAQKLPYDSVQKKLWKEWCWNWILALGSEENLNWGNLIFAYIYILDESSAQLGTHDEGQGLANRSCQEQEREKSGKVFEAQIKRRKWETTEQQETS